MKKFVVFILLISCLCSTMFFKTSKNPLFAANSGVEKVCFVSNEVYEEMESVQCGNFVFNFCSLEKANENLNKFQSKASAVQFYLSISMKEVLSILKAEIVTTQNLDNLEIVCAYTPYFQQCVFVDGKKVNLQIAQKDGLVVAGMPAIITGF